MKTDKSAFISNGKSPGLAGLSGYTLGDRSLSKGARGDDVRALQMALLAAGYKLPQYGPDGDYGSETQHAVMEFQRKNGLPQTGRADAATIKALQAKGASGVTSGKTGIKIIDDAFESMKNTFKTAAGDFSWVTGDENWDNVQQIDQQQKQNAAAKKRNNTVYWLAGGAAAAGLLGVVIAASGDDN